MEVYNENDIKVTCKYFIISNCKYMYANKPFPCYDFMSNCTFTNITWTKFIMYKKHLFKVK